MPNQVFILEELLSPIVTPFILIFLLRNKSLEIIDFFRNFTVEVVGVGDICSFAQMDIRRHGNPTVGVLPSIVVLMSSYCSLNAVQMLFYSGCQRARRRPPYINRLKMEKRSCR